MKKIKENRGIYFCWVSIDIGEYISCENLNFFIKIYKEGGEFY